MRGTLRVRHDVRLSLRSSAQLRVPFACGTLSRHSRAGIAQLLALSARMRALVNLTLALPTCR